MATRATLIRGVCCWFDVRLGGPPLSLAAAGFPPHLPRSRLRVDAGPPGRAGPPRRWVPSPFLCPGVGEAASFIDRKQVRGRARPGLGKLRAVWLDRIPCLLRGPPSSLPGRGHCSVSRRNEGAAQVHADSACSHATRVITSIVRELPFLPAPAHLKCPERRSLSRISVSFSRAFYEQASWQAAPSGGMLPESALPHRPGLVLPSRNPPPPDSSALGSVHPPPAAIVLAVRTQSINSSHRPPPRPPAGVSSHSVCADATSLS